MSPAACGSAWGKLTIVAHDSGQDLTVELTQTELSFGRSKTCDFQINSKEVSRHTARIYTEDEQAWLCSVGHSPVTLNGVLVESGHPALLQTGDSFEVHFEGRSKVFRFEAAFGDDEETLIIRPLPVQPQRVPLPAPRRTPRARPRGAAVAPPPAPPVPPRGSLLLPKATTAVPSEASQPARPPAPSAAGGAARMDLGALESELQAKLAGRKRRLEEGSEQGAPPPRRRSLPRGAAPKAAFAPDPLDLQKLRAGLRPTGKENSARKPSGNDAGFCDFMAAREATGRLAPGSAAKAAASGGKKVASAAKGAAARAASRTPGSRRGGAPSASARKRKVVRFSLEAAGRQTPEGLAAAADMAATVDIGLAMAAVQPLVDRGADDTVAFAEWAMGGGSKGSPAGTPAAGLERRRSSADGASRRRSGSRLRVSSASLHTIAEETAAENGTEDVPAPGTDARSVMGQGSAPRPPSRLSLRSATPAKRASGGMIAAAPAGANPDAGALLASAGLGAEQRSDVGDRRAKRARARLGAGLNKGQKLAAAHAALQLQHAAACRQVRVLRKVLACQRAAAVEERGARVAAETRLKALLLGAQVLRTDAAVPENPMRTEPAQAGHAVMHAAGAGSGTDAPAAVVAGAPDPRGVSPAAGSVELITESVNVGLGAEQEAGLPAGPTLLLTPAADATATPSIPTTVPEATRSGGRPSTEGPAGAAPGSEQEGDQTAPLTVGRRRSGPADSRHADLAPTPRTVGEPSVTKALPHATPATERAGDATGDTVPIAGSMALRLSVTKRLSKLVKAAGKTPSTVLQKQDGQGDRARRPRAPTPLSSLPRGFFREPRERRASNAPSSIEEVPAWLFACGDITEAEVAVIAATIDESVGDIMLALAGEDTPRTLVAPAVPQHKVVSDAGVIDAGSADVGGDGDACMACGEGGGGRVMLLCDGCDRACHLKCTVPRLRRTPAGDWFCAECTNKTVPAPEQPSAQPAVVEHVAEENKPASQAPAPPSAVDAKAPTASKSRRGAGAGAIAGEAVPPASSAARKRKAPPAAAAETAPQKAKILPAARRTTRQR